MSLPGCLFPDTGPLLWYGTCHSHVFKYLRLIYVE